MYNWVEERTPEESLVILRTLADQCAILGGPVAKQLNYLAQTDYQSLMDRSLQFLEEHSMIDVQDAIYGNQILALFQKSQFLQFRPGWDPEQEAAKRFARSERMCLETNRRLRASASAPQIMGHGIAGMLHVAQQKIADILGVCPNLDKLPFAFGPGANTNVKGSRANPRAKLSVPLECSSNMSPTVGDLLSEVPHWAASHAIEQTDASFIVNVTVVPGKVIFVPKNAKTARSIVVEPLLNSFFQKGLGSYIRDRLKRFDIDLRDQTRNQQLACRGSIDGSLATCDLSMASDCLSRELVWSLLPFDWSNLLDQLRSGEVVLPKNLDQIIIDDNGLTELMTPNSPYWLQKFSSMGNGFTFELESLIFYGLCYAACKHTNSNVQDIGVYGDDLIVPVNAYDALTQLLSYCGFSLNSEKSFGTGRFRESCGADYLDGFDIRPYYQKQLISDRTLYSMHNWFVRHGERELACICLQFINKEQALFGPDGFGDGHLIGTHSLRHARNIVRAQWGGGYFDTYVLRPRSFKGLMAGDALLPTYSVYTRSGEESPTDPFRVRGSCGYAKVSIYTLGSSIFSRKD